MKKILKPLLCILWLATFVLISHLTGLLYQNAGTIKMDSIKEISLSIKEGTVTNTGMTIIIKDETGTINNYYYNDYRIEKRIKNRWKELNKNKITVQTSKDKSPEKVEDYDEDKKIEMDIDWKIYYGELEPGRYRFIKKCDIENYRPYEFSVEFEIE